MASSAPYRILPPIVSSDGQRTGNAADVGDGVIVGQHRSQHVPPAPFLYTLLHRSIGPPTTNGGSAERVDTDTILNLGQQTTLSQRNTTNSFSPPPSIGYAEEIAAAAIRAETELDLPADGVVTLIVGGKEFMTSIATLTRERDSMLEAMFSGRHVLKSDSRGRYFIDRDGRYFRYILNYLRDGDLEIPDPKLIKPLLVEARFYQLKGLEQILHAQLISPMNWLASTNSHVVVYHKTVFIGSADTQQAYGGLVQRAVIATPPFRSGKHYFEIKVHQVSNFSWIGLADMTDFHPGAPLKDTGWAVGSSGSVYVKSNTTYCGVACTNLKFGPGDVIGFFLDMDRRTASLYKNRALEHKDIFTELPDEVCPAASITDHAASYTLDVKKGIAQWDPEPITHGR